MAETLTEFLKGRKCRGFKAVPMYFPGGDFVSYFTNDERCVARRVDNLLTIYVSPETGRMVGVKIKSVRHILEKYREFGVRIERDGLRLEFFFYLVAIVKEKQDREVYEKAREFVKDAVLDPGVLLQQAA